MCFFCRVCESSLERLFVSQFSDSILKQRSCYQTKNLLKKQMTRLHHYLKLFERIRVGTNQEACNIVIFRTNSVFKFPCIFNLILNRFKLVDVKLLLLLSLLWQAVHKIAMKIYCNRLKNFNSLELKFLIRSRLYNAVASMDFMNSDKIDLADKMI